MLYEKELDAMVAQQLEARGINDGRVLEAFRKVPRREFVPQELSTEAHADYPLPIGEGQTISQPYMAALMTERLKLKGPEKVLEIGAGSGYQTAILASLASEVYSVERFQALADRAARTLDKLGYKNVKIRVADGTLGWPEFAPYDAIIVTAGAPSAPPSLLAQLKDKGRLVIPIGDKFNQVLTIIEKGGDRFLFKEAGGCVFVPLVGREGWR